MLLDYISKDKTFMQMGGHKHLSASHLVSKNAKMSSLIQLSEKLRGDSVFCVWPK